MERKEEIVKTYYRPKCYRQHQVTVSSSVVKIYSTYRPITRTIGVK